MNRFYSNIHMVVARHCSRGGVDAKFVKIVQNYNTDTGENVETMLEYRFRALEFDYERYNSGAASQSGTSVEKADKQYLVDPLTIVDTAGNKVWPIILPAQGDIVVCNGVTSTVVLTKEISPDSRTAVMLEIQTKR